MNTSFDPQDILCIVYANDIKAIQIDREDDKLILHINGSLIELSFDYSDITEMALDLNEYIHTLNRKTEQIVITQYGIYSWSEVKKFIKEIDD